uniref:tRNA(His) guanylyltransferase n=1 Tax=Simocephalus serrulatus TaxID=117539 RepID=A0A4Y7NNS2_9CRUS|nr:EOG090X0AR4 [Simocephalus serrulatus]SVE94413.1 EOG090X0AR4 [Simocephalus serrulatus]
MAKSKFEYVRLFESEDRCLPNTWIVVRVDGKGFHKFSAEHNYEKPNDIRSLSLMTHAATSVMEEFKDICLAYGQSDEYSFIFRKETQAYSRRSSKLSTNVCSLFTSAFVYHWSEHFPTISKPLYPPVFDGRTVLYPSDQNMRDYLSWRQADCHINNLYNTTFWTLIQKAGMSPNEAEKILKGTLSGDKNEILFSQFGINYNNEPEMFRKGTLLVRRRVPVPLPNGGTREKSQIIQQYADVIGDEFWKENSHLLASSS